MTWSMVIIVVVKKNYGTYRQHNVRKRNQAENL